MIVSEQWLREWIDLPLDAQKIADTLTNAGLEVDGIEALPGKIDHLVVGQITEVSAHPDADKLQLTKVDVGGEVLDIVCGAANAREGLVVAVATIGAKLPNGMKIKQAKVRGAESNGMLCSASELGLEEASSGILELDSDAEIGQRIDEYLLLEDNLIDIDLTPNRGDCLSIQGIARELNVLADGDYQPLDIKNIQPSSEQSIDIELQDSDACPRYIGRVITGINPLAVSPIWLTERLRRSGIKPISPVVDITNYVMMELGQPMHAFDLSKLQGQIIVRQSSKGETIKLLDDSTASLDGDTLVIADQKGPIAIAGVMGGLDSAIDDASTDIVLEAAHFTRISAAGRARRYGLHTESSHRFERGVDPQLPQNAIKRATELVLKICGGDAGPINEQINQAGLQNKPSVSLGRESLTSLLGMELDQEEVTGILTRVADTLTTDEASWSVTPPSFRFDIANQADLVEEVARVKGYDSIPTKMPKIVPTSVVASEKSLNVRQVRQALVARDFREVITYSFIDPNTHDLFSKETPVRLSNPLAENMSVMRTSLLPGLINALEFNINRQHQRVRLFEIGATYHTVDGKNDQEYKEVQTLAGVITGLRENPQWGIESKQAVDFYDLKADVEAVLSLTGQKKPIIFKRFEHIALHPGQVSVLSYLDESGFETEIGWIGRLHPVLQKKYGFTTNVFTFELQLDKALQAKIPEFSSISRYPSIKRDLSILIQNEATAFAIIDVIRTKLGSTLTNIDIFDVYRGAGVADGQKSVSISMTLQHHDKTMTDEEAEEISANVLSALKEKFGATLRV